jgi:MraZ protein
MSNFYGCHALNMDTKGRIAIPTRVREDLAEVSGGHIVVTANADEERCLAIYPEPQWQEVKQQVEALPNMSKAARRLQRKVLGHATPLELDSAGRILVPPTLRSYARMDKKLMLVGQGKKLELWSEERWNDWMDGGEDDGEMPPEMESLSL